ncbi:BppU family phage baseplate upper protein, partial [Clostridium botulinum]|uniref:BppU family phage baseplate upper protein n=1 Tax=Clostridium botulinum TaxID=1491 RepID=UPI003DA60F68
MDKPFNLLIDTKRTGFNAVRGLKQGDNNSVLNITLVQNSVPFDLTGTTIRINYKRPDNKIFLQMADVVNATDGEVKINILTKALESIGEIKADLSIFDKDNRKITSATFSMFVDSSVYRNDYIDKEDL